jgi:hypothetical protein
MYAGILRSRPQWAGVAVAFSLAWLRMNRHEAFDKLGPGATALVVAAMTAAVLPLFALFVKTLAWVFGRRIEVLTLINLGNYAQTPGLLVSLLLLAIPQAGDIGLRIIALTVGFVIAVYCIWLYVAGVAGLSCARR